MARHILVPVDLAHESSWNKTLPEAFEQAQKMGGSVTVMTVVPDILAGLDWRYAIRGETGGSEDFDMHKLVERAEQDLEKLVSQYLPDGMTAETLARHGVIYQEILKVSEELSVDQIIMAAHRPSLADYLLGPNTARVVRHATCSVNVIRSD